MALVLERLAIAMISIPAEPLDAANVSVSQGTVAAGGRRWRWKDCPGHLTRAGGSGKNGTAGQKRTQVKPRGENRWGPYHLTLPVF